VNQLKVDVEGAELDVLQGATRLLDKYRPVVLLSTHSPGRRDECHRLLIARGYTIHGEDRRQQAAETDEVIAVPARAPAV